MTFVLAHGFTQTARSWSVIAGLLGVERCHAVDLPGHGDAGQVRVPDLWAAADHLARSGGVGTYVGYSMGGRIALHAALTHPALVERLVLIGATAGIDDDAERERRRLDDDALAAHIEHVGVEVFVDEWLGNPLFAGLDPATAGRADRLRNTAAGLASSLRTTGTGTQEPLWHRLGDIGCPTLVVVGAHDDKFRRLGQRMVDHLPDATMEVVEGAGHSVHLERPEATAAAIVDWADRQR